MVKAKSRPPEKWQLGLTFDELPAAKANAEENQDVPQADRGLPNPLPAGAESPTPSGTGASDLSGNSDIRNAGHAQSIAGTGSGERAADQPIAAGNGSRSDLAGNVFTTGLGAKPALRPVQTGFAFLDAPATPSIEPDTLPPQTPKPTLESQPFRLTLTDNPSTLGFKAKAKATLAAIRLLKTLEAENRPATVEEKHTLAGFSGFGMLANYIFPEPGTQHFKPGWEALGAELAELLTPEEYESAKRSTFNAFYTSPTVMQAIYDGLARMGVPQTGIHALEPGCGIGNFIGMAPTGMQFTGIEKEVLSGRIAKALYPEQDIRIEPFQQTALPAGSIDVAIGNVPFSDLTLKWQESKLPLHDYFFAKALDSLHAGGVLALVTSRYTLDKQDATFRKYLAEQADFLGAIRLPKGAFRQEGTEVVTDVVFLRKREPQQAPAHAGDWLTTEALPGSKAQCNRYFLEHPKMVIGDLAEDRGMYGNHELTVPFPTDYQQRLQAALNWLPENAYSAADRNQQPAAQQTTFSQQAAPARKLLPGSLFKGQDGQIMTVVNETGTAEPLIYGNAPVNALSGTVGARLAALIGIRDAARAVLESQREGRSAAEKATARQQLNQRYEKFVRKWGAINKTTIATQADGTITRRQPNLTAFKDDPDVYLVMALEQYDEKTDTAAKMPIMQRDVVGPTPPIEQVKSALDGLLVSLNQRGRVDLPYIARLYGVAEAEVIKELGSHIYYDPAQSCYVTAEEYLSGNVREKLRLAHEYAGDARVAVGLPALQEAQPDLVPPGDIDVTLGASWVPADMIQGFIAELLNCEPSEISVRHLEKEAFWFVETSATVKGKVEAISTYGTDERPALTLINDALNMRVPTVTKTVTIGGKEHQLPDQEATLAAREKQKAIKQAFQQWLFADPSRADMLTERYNRLFNTTRLRRYDGSHLTFPEMNPEIELRQHQKDAVWRVMNSRNTLLAHAVGAGKTFEMIAAGLKMKQAGLVRKPLYVVPNHMLEQFAREFYLLYPNAKVLVASKDDFTKEKRKLLTAKVASGEWDGIIMTHSSFEKIGMSPAFQADFVREQIADYEALLTDMKQGADTDSKRLIKRIEKQKEQWEERLGELTNAARKDTGLTFEDLGVDHLFMDEAHLFKNLETPTKMGQVAGVQTSGSLRAFDLFMKTRYLDKYGHGTSFATGTPVSNSMVEMYTMSRFLAPELHAERGISHFDGWAAVFGDIVDTVELSPDAQSLRQNRRFARFVNLPELLQIFHSFADVKMADSLNLPRPALKDGKATIIATPMSEHQRRIQKDLVERYERVRGGKIDPKVDNALKITTDGRKLALDARLVLPHLPEEAGKIDAVAENVYSIWERTKDSRATQMVFCDLGVSNADGQFSVYAAIVRKLVAQGIPAQEIACMGDYDTDLKKARLFTRVRNGDVRVLLGSTQKMGTGTNVQERLIALHHVDAPWKPAEVEQREGRILRQGNRNKEVEIYRYVTEGSFDAYMWQTLQTKAEFISQIMKGDLTIRRMEDMDDQALSYAEVKAIASGNPAVLTLAKMEMEAQRLTQLGRAHKNEQYRIRQTIRQMEDADLPMLQRRQGRIAADLATLVAHGGRQSPALVVEGKTITHPKAAQEALRAAIERQWELLAYKLEPALNGEQESMTIGNFGGLAVELTLEKSSNAIRGALGLRGQFYTSRPLRGPGSDRLLEYLNELATTLPALSQETKEKQTALETQLDGLQKRLGLPFEHEAKLTQLTDLRSELQGLLQSDSPNHANPNSNGEETETTQAAAATTLAKEAVQERTAAIVRAFAALMKDSSPSTETLSMPQQPPAARPWIEKVEPTTPISLRERYAVAY